MVILSFEVIVDTFFIALFYSFLGPPVLYSPLSHKKTIFVIFLAFYGNLNPGTGFDNNNSDGTAAIIEPKHLGNRTDYLQLTKNGSQKDVFAYMICNFSQWETKQSTRDHCENI